MDSAVALQRLRLQSSYLLAIALAYITLRLTCVSLRCCHQRTVSTHVSLFTFPCFAVTQLPPKCPGARRVALLLWCCRIDSHRVASRYRHRVFRASSEMPLLARGTCCTPVAAPSSGVSFWLRGTCIWLSLVSLLLNHRFVLSLGALANGMPFWGGLGLRLDGSSSWFFSCWFCCTGSARVSFRISARGVCAVVAILCCRPRFPGPLSPNLRIHSYRVSASARHVAVGNGFLLRRRMGGRGMHFAAPVSSPMLGNVACFFISGPKGSSPR